MSTSHPSLPIDAIQTQFDACERRQPLVVVAPTGSGKSTRLPLWLASMEQGQVLVVEPRRVACRALATYLSELRGEAVGESVGYQVRFEAKMSAATQIAFVTPGMALRLLSTEAAWRWSAVLIDEFHERQWEVDLLVALLLQRQATSSLRLVLTSATIAGRELAKRLDAGVLEADGRSFDVSIEHLDAPSAPSLQGLEERVLVGLKRMLARDDDGDILVFLPGKGEIDACSRALQSVARKRDLSLLPVHGSLSLDQLSRAFAAKASQRRVYLATNVAETSLTLPGVTGVIDAGLVRTRLHRSGRSALALVPVTASQMVQRSGRAGRVAPGHCIRLWQESFRPSSEIRPEVERIELDDLVLQAAIGGLEGDAFGGATWVTTPPDFAVEEARRRLSQIGALDEREHLTEFGRSLASWPLSALEASLLVGAPDGLSATLADLVSLLQQRGPLLADLGRLSEEEREGIVSARRSLLDPCRDEVFAALTLLRKGQQMHKLRQRPMQQARAIARQLRRKLGLRCVDPTRDDTPFPTADELAAWLLSCAPQLGFVRRKRADAKPKGRARHLPMRTSEPWANGEIELMVEPYVSTDPDVSLKNPRAGVILAHTWVGGRGLQVQGRGRMLLPCRPETLARAGLGYVEVSTPTLSRKGGLSIEADVCVVLAGVVLRADSETLEGEALRSAVVSLMLDGRWWSERFEALLDRLHLLALLSSWPPPREWIPCSEARAWREDPASFLMERLASLGLEQAEEMELIEAEDLLPDLTRLLQIDPYTLADMTRDFPRQWEHLGAVYDCLVTPTKRLVRLVPHNRSAKKAKEPNARLLPAFRGFRVDFQKASRIVKLR